jgi:predicted negative regulator of RcsB-dependent stress response
MNIERYFEEFEDFVKENLRLILLCIALMGAMVSGWLIFDHIKTKRAEASLEMVKEFLEMQAWPIKSIEDSVTPSTAAGKEFSSQEEKDAKIGIALQNLAANKNQSGARAFILLQKARKFIQASDLSAAQRLIESEIGSYSSSSLEHSILRLNLALIKLKSDNQSIVNEGIAALEAIAYKDKYLSDVAYYQLGQFTWKQGRTEEAKNFWNSLVAEHYQDAPKEGSGSSPWAKKAAEKRETVF